LFVSLVDFTTYRLIEAVQVFPALDFALAWSKPMTDGGQGVALVVPHEHAPDGLGVDGPLTLFLLDESVEAELSQLAGQRFNVTCRDSLDLLSRSALIQLQTDAVCVELDAWRFDLDFFDRESGRYCLGLLAGSSFVLARHHLNATEVELLVVDLQATCGCSGPNYDPYRIWTDEQLAEATQRVSEDEPTNGRRRIECVVVELSGGDLPG